MLLSPFSLPALALFVAIAFTYGPVVLLVQLFALLLPTDIQRALLRKSVLVHGGFMAMLTHIFCPLQIVLSGKHREMDRDKYSLLMANHQLYTDWWYIWLMAWSRSAGSLKLSAMKEFLSVPIFGWSFQLMDFIAMARKWPADKVNLDKVLTRVLDDPSLWLVVFPEGTLVCDETSAKTHKFANLMNLPLPSHTLVPKTTGIHHTVEKLRPRLTHIYDLTIAYPSHQKQWAYDKYTIENCLFRRSGPSKVFIHIDRFDIADIPAEQKEFDDWMRKRFMQKDELLRNFYLKGEFSNEKEGAVDKPEVLSFQNNWKDWRSSMFSSPIPSSSNHDTDKVNKVTNSLVSKRAVSAKQEQEKLSYLRFQSQFKLRNSWEKICHKYGKDFSEVTDEIDLVNDVVVIDRGFVRNTPPKIFGESFMAPRSDKKEMLEAWGTPSCRKVFEETGLLVSPGSPYISPTIRKKSSRFIQDRRDASNIREFDDLSQDVIRKRNTLNLIRKPSELLTNRRKSHHECEYDIPSNNENIGRELPRQEKFREQNPLINQQSKPFRVLRAQSCAPKHYISEYSHFEPQQYSHQSSPRRSLNNRSSPYRLNPTVRKAGYGHQSATIDINANMPSLELRRFSHFQNNEDRRGIRGCSVSADSRKSGAQYEIERPHSSMSRIFHDKSKTDQQKVQYLDDYEQTDRAESNRGGSFRGESEDFIVPFKADRSRSSMYTRIDDDMNDFQRSHPVRGVSAASLKTNGSDSLMSKGFDEHIVIDTRRAQSSLGYRQILTDSKNGKSSRNESKRSISSMDIRSTTEFSRPQSSFGYECKQHDIAMDESRFDNDRPKRASLHGKDLERKIIQIDMQRGVPFRRYSLPLSEVRGKQQVQLVNLRALAPAGRDTATKSIRLASKLNQENSGCSDAERTSSESETSRDSDEDIEEDAAKIPLVLSDAKYFEKCEEVDDILFGSAHDSFGNNTAGKNDGEPLMKESDKCEYIAERVQVLVGQDDIPEDVRPIFDKPQEKCNDFFVVKKAYITAPEPLAAIDYSIAETSLFSESPGIKNVTGKGEDFFLLKKAFISDKSVKVSSISKPELFLGAMPDIVKDDGQDFFIVKKNCQVPSRESASHHCEVIIGVIPTNLNDPKEKEEEFYFFKSKSGESKHVISGNFQGAANSIYTSVSEIGQVYLKSEDDPVSKKVQKYLNSEGAPVTNEVVQKSINSEDTPVIEMFHSQIIEMKETDGCSNFSSDVEDSSVAVRSATNKEIPNFMDKKSNEEKILNMNLSSSVLINQPDMFNSGEDSIVSRDSQWIDGVVDEVEFLAPLPGSSPIVRIVQKKIRYSSIGEIV